MLDPLNFRFVQAVCETLETMKVAFMSRSSFYDCRNWYYLPAIKHVYDEDHNMWMDLIRQDMAKVPTHTFHAIFLPRSHFRVLISSTYHKESTVFRASECVSRETGSTTVEGTVPSTVGTP